MRILHINSTVVINSGVMSVLMNYYRHIDTNKLQFDFLYFSKSVFKYETYEQEIHQLGGKIFYIENFKKIKAFNNQLRKIIKNNSYKTVHIHDAFVLNFIYQTLRDSGVVNIIVHSHATRWSDKKLNGIRNKMLCCGLNKKVDYPFACSVAAGRFMFGKEKEFYVMNNAIDLDKYEFNEQKRINIRRELGIEGKHVLGHVGNICKQKNHDFLIDVFKVLAEKDNDAILVLIGDGVLRQEIEKKVNRLGILSRTIFLGKRNNVFDYYNAFDCLVLPSLYEGLPMVGVEAQCNGLPVLFSDTITNEVGGERAYYLSLNDKAIEWADVICKMFNDEIDRKAGKKIAAELGFDINVEAKKLQSEYSQIEEGL